MICSDGTWRLTRASAVTDVRCASRGSVLERIIGVLGIKGMRVFSVAAIWVFLGCSAAAPSREDEAARLQAKLFFVQSVACLSPATQMKCDPGLAAAFGEPSSSGITTDKLTVDRSKGSIWCEEGRPHVRVSTPSREITGEFGQVVWEAIWRVLKATDLCASAYGRAVSITRDGQMHACKDPRFDMHQLFDIAIVQAKIGPPAALRGAMNPGSGAGICEIDPEACGPPSHSLCPRFLGDPWNGVTAERHESADSEPDVGPDDSGDPSETREPGQRPTQREITNALGAVLKEARKCLKPNAPMSTATVRFRFDGAVQSVEVRGGEAPAKACIEQALRRARVSSFGDPSFEVGVTIRAHE